jgi:MFS family permease
MHFGRDERQLGIGTSALLFGCIPGAIIAGRVTDIYRRKFILNIVALLFAL